MPDRKDPDDVVELDEGTRIDDSPILPPKARKPEPVSLDGDSEATRFAAVVPTQGEPDGGERTVLIESPFVPPSRSEPPAPSPPRARIEIESGPDAGRTWPLEGPGPFLVGRSLDCAVVLNDPTASRKHFEIRFLGDEWRLRDLGSGNGTLVDGTRVDRETSLAPDSLIEAGRTRVRFRADLGAPSRSVPPPSDEEKTRVVEAIEAVSLPAPTTAGKFPTSPSGAAGPRHPPGPRPSSVLPGTMSRADEDEEGETGGFPWLPVAGGVVVAILLAIGIAQFGFGVRILPIGGDSEPTQEEIRRAEEVRRQQRTQETQRRLREALAAHQWDRAISLAQQAQQEGLPLENLEQDLALAKAEQRNRSLVEAAREALEQDALEEARRLLAQIPDSSVLHSEAREMIASIDRQGLQQRLDEIRTLLRSGRKADVRKAFLTLVTEFPEDPRLDDLRKELLAAGVVLDPPASPSDSTGGRPATPSDRATSSKGAKEKALALYREGKFQEAVELLRRSGRGGASEGEEELVLQLERFSTLLAEGREAVRNKRLDRAESVLQQALRYDQILGGAFAQEIRSLLGATYRGRAAAAIAEADYVTGSKSAQRALDYNADDSVAQEILDKCLLHAQRLYEEAVKDAQSGRTADAQAKARKVLDILPKRHPLVEKAASLLR